MNPFEQIPNIINRRRAFLEEMCAHYNSTNRAVNIVLDKCYYEKSETSRGCAIGAWCPEVAYLSGSVVAPNIWDKLPKWMTEMGDDFLHACQVTHDYKHYWKRAGLSASGHKRKQKLLDTYCYETVQETNEG